MWCTSSSAATGVTWCYGPARSAACGRWRATTSCSSRSPSRARPTIRSRSSPTRRRSCSASLPSPRDCCSRSLCSWARSWRSWAALERSASITSPRWPVSSHSYRATSSWWRCTAGATSPRCGPGGRGGPTTSTIALLRRPRRTPVDDVVDRGRRADVAHRVQRVRRVEDDRARAYALPHAIAQRLERAFAEDDEFFVRVFVRVVRREARLERRDVHLELLEGCRRLTHDVAHRPDVRRVVLQLIPVEHRRAEDRLRLGLLCRQHAPHTDRCGDRRDDDIPACDREHVKRSLTGDSRPVAEAYQNGPN